MNDMPNQIQKDLASCIEMFSCLYSDSVNIRILDSNLSVAAQYGTFPNDEFFACKPVTQCLKTGLPCSIENPASHPLCEGCQNLSGCRAQFLMCFPAHDGENSSGVIVLTGNDENQRHTLAQNQEKIRHFFALSSSLISRQISTNRSSIIKDALINQQSRLLNLIQEGVLLFSSSGRLLYMNERAERTLGNTVPQLLYLKKTGRFSVKKGIPSLSGPDEYIINVKNKTIRLWGTSSPVTDQNGLEEDRVFIFSDYEIIPKICPATDQKKASL